MLKDPSAQNFLQQVLGGYEADEHVHHGKPFAVRTRLRNQRG